MNLLALTASLSLGLAGVAAASAPGDSAPCQADACRSPSSAQQRGASERYDWPQHHVMTKAEARAELDAIRTTAPSAQAVNTQMAAVAPASRYAPEEQREP